MPSIELNTCLFSPDNSVASWSPNSTDLYFWYLFVELAVVTPVEPRNFVSVVPAAKKGKLGPIFF